MLVDEIDYVILSRGFPFGSSISVPVINERLPWTHRVFENGKVDFVLLCNIKERRRIVRSFFYILDEDLFCLLQKAKVGTRISSASVEQSSRWVKIFMTMR